MVALIFPTMGMPELLIILAIIILLFGARRLPELATGLGKSIRAFKQATNENQIESKAEPAPLTQRPD